MRELDIVHVLKQARQTSLLSQILLTQKQKTLLKFQRKNLIETSSSSADSDDQCKIDKIKLMDHKNPLIRLGVYGKLKRMVETFKNQDLDQIDQTEKRLIRGIFIKRLQDFDE
jgi:hypothetical protein